MTSDQFAEPQKVARETSSYYSDLLAKKRQDAITDMHIAFTTLHTGPHTIVKDEAYWQEQYLLDYIDQARYEKEIEALLRARKDEVQQGIEAATQALLAKTTETCNRAVARWRDILCYVIGGSASIYEVLLANMRSPWLLCVAITLWGVPVFLET